MSGTLAVYDAALAEPLEDDLSEEAVGAHVITKILLAQKSIAGVRISVDQQVMWPLLDLAPGRMLGTVTQWIVTQGAVQAQDYVE